MLDNGEVKGQIVTDSTIRDIADIIMQNIEPRITPTIEHIIIDNKSVLKVMFNGTSKPYSAFGKFLIRIGTQNRKMDREELLNILGEITYTLSWEKEESEFTTDNINSDTLNNFYNEGLSCDKIPNGYNPKDLFKMLNLITKNGHLTNGGYALFGKNANIRLKIARFATDEKITFINLKFYNDNIYNLINDAMLYLAGVINYYVEIGTMQRTEIPEIPIRALREIIINAFAHADYRSDPEIEINIHPSMITIYNPGPFPDNLTPFDFINDSISSIKRNPVIFDVLFRRKDVEKSGTGFKRVNDLCTKEGIKWTYKNTTYGFYLTFFRKNYNLLSNKLKPIANDGLTKTEQTILNLINQNPKIKKDEIANFTHLAKRTIQRYIASLTKKGYIIRIGNNQTGYFEILK